ncbi:hypothetical protein [Candidatus Villigracilis saccharophilus]|uniref:hypothetical protein n=1 Tax=Candidatus Villigracilis saccharophilus TaxID=3140684 RepID=UPI003136D1E4|nr:hypothetical protein [Anaerolineales bacterium]
MKKARPYIILTLLLAMLSLSGMAKAATPPDSSRPSMDVTTTPPPTPTSTPPRGRVDHQQHLADLSSSGLSN